LTIRIEPIPGERLELLPPKKEQQGRIKRRFIGMSFGM
jgi:hypothetical protein